MAQNTRRNHMVTHLAFIIKNGKKQKTLALNNRKRRKVKSTQKKRKHTYLIDGRTYISNTHGGGYVVCRKRCGNRGIRRESTEKSGFFPKERKRSQRRSPRSQGLQGFCGGGGRPIWLPWKGRHLPQSGPERIWSQIDPVDAIPWAQVQHLGF